MLRMDAEVMMCGICGIAYSDPDRSIDEARLVRMRDSMAHRGPDGAGSWCDGNVGIAHRRLSIIDIAGGHQPLSNETGDVWVTFNGEIYNYQALKKELTDRGHHFRTRSDTEVLVHGYEEYGTALFGRLNGIFAFALYDLKQRRLLLVRDQLGIKPLFYSATSEGLFFGSEIKAVLAGSDQRALMRPESLQEYLIFRYIAGEQTIIRGVQRLAPGNFLTWQDGRYRCEEYWSPATSTVACSLADAADELDRRLSNAVQLQLMSDVPLGSFLSGGIDSGLVSGYAARNQGNGLDTFSIGFEDGAWDETPLARDSAARFGTRHHTVTFRPTEFRSLLPALIRYNDEPLSHPNSVPLYLLSRFARERVTVVLTGEGADELFGGYPRYHLARLSHSLRYLGGPGRAGVAALLNGLPGHRGRKAAESLAMSFDDSLLFNSAYVDPALVSRLTGNDVRAALQPRYATLERSRVDNDPIATLSRYELRTYLVCALERMDRMSMAHGLEGRVPFLDVNLVDWATQLSSRLKVTGRHNKRVVKYLAEGFLSRTVTRAPKSGFGVPLGDWMRNNEMLDLVSRLLDRDHPALEYLNPRVIRQLVNSHMSGRHDHGEALWMLINVFIWYELHTDYVSRAVSGPQPLFGDGPTAEFAAGQTAELLAGL